MKRYVPSFLLVSFVGITTFVQAEGSKDGQWQGANGANRVVRSRDGYRGVHGIFTVPRVFGLPVVYTRINGVADKNRPRINRNLVSTSRNRNTVPGGYAADEFDYYLRNVPANAPTGQEQRSWYFSNNSNPQNSKPSFYLGSGATDGNNRNIEVDAGLQYEWLPRYQSPPGWSAFLSVNTRFHHPAPVVFGDGATGPFRSGPGTPFSTVKTFELFHEIRRHGSPDRTVASLRAIMQPTANQQASSFRISANVNIPANRLGSINVKRVTAMTQRQLARLDGSYMEGAVLSSGEVAVLANNRIVYHPWGLRNGVPYQNDVEQDDTGYVPGSRSNQVARNGRDQGNPQKFVVDFPRITALARQRYHCGATGRTSL